MSYRIFCLLFFTSLFQITVQAGPPTAESPKTSTPIGWAATYGGDDHDFASSIHETRDGGSIVAGKTKSFGAGDFDLWVLKLRANGAVEWQKTYGGNNLDEANSIHETSDGGYIVAGWTKSFGAGGADAWVLKLRPDGAIEWQKTYGGDNNEMAISIQQTSDGGYIVAGNTDSFGAGEADVWVLKLRSDGGVEWQKAYGGDNNEMAISIQQTSDGGYVVAGWMCSFSSGNVDFWVLKLRVDGTVEWQKAYGGVDEDVIYSIQQTRDGGYIVAGVTASFNAGRDYEVWVLKLRVDGTVEWQKTYGGTYYDEVRSIFQTRDGGYIMAGCTMSFSSGGTDVWVLKLRSDGIVKWQKAYGGVSEDIADSIQQTSDGGYIVAGWTLSFGAGERDALILKLRPDGFLHPPQADRDRPIDPSCEFMRDTSTSGVNSNATILDTPASTRDTNANPQDSPATTSTTIVSAHILCPKTVD